MNTDLDQATCLRSVAARVAKHASVADGFKSGSSGGLITPILLDPGERTLDDMIGLDTLQ